MTFNITTIQLKHIDITINTSTYTYTYAYKTYTQAHREIKSYRQDAREKELVALC